MAYMKNAKHIRDLEAEGNTLVAIITLKPGCGFPTQHGYTMRQISTGTFEYWKDKPTP